MFLNYNRPITTIITSVILQGWSRFRDLKKKKTLSTEVSGQNFSLSLNTTVWSEITKTKYCLGNGNSNNGIEDTGPEYIVRGDVPLTLIGGARKAIYPPAA